MSKLIECNACKKTMYEDSRSEKGAYHELWIDQCAWYHLCRDCYLKLLRLFFPLELEDEEDTDNDEI